jgi:Spy/CpxP family protein refolding chaperone
MLILLYNRRMTLVVILVIGTIGFIYLTQSLPNGLFPLSYAQSSTHSGHGLDVQTNITSKYSGQDQNRIIKSLSVEDITSLKTGTGDAFGGMALLAELNGYPGPRHVLDLANELELSNEQKQNITAVYNNMKNKAIKLGQEIVDTEKGANDAFANKSISDLQLKQLIIESAQAYGQLRYVHLSTHLSMLDILTPEQVSLYNQLRGYSRE